MAQTEFSRKLITLREKNGLSQKELADAIGFNKSIINRLETGAREPNYGQVKHLCEAFDVPINDLLQYTTMGEQTMLSKLSVVNKDKAKTIEYHGADETYNGLIEFRDAVEKIAELDELRRLMGRDEEDNYFSWSNENNFFVLVEPNTGAVKGIRDFGQNMAFAGELFFTTGYIPVMFLQAPSKEGFLMSIEKTRQRFLDEVKTAKEKAKFKKPLFLIQYMGNNSYYAFDLTKVENGYTEDALITVYDYKSYRKHFTVSSCCIKSEEEIVSGHEYYVYTPSDAFIAEAGLELYPNIWTFQMGWDKWEERAEWSPALTDDMLAYYNGGSVDLQDFYNDAIFLVNLGRKENFSNSEKDFAHLETSLRRFEKLAEMKAPRFILEDEVTLFGKFKQALIRL